MKVTIRQLRRIIREALDQPGLGDNDLDRYEDELRQAKEEEEEEELEVFLPGIQPQYPDDRTRKD
jgi:hypothetical protein